jgi:hypothetical protein
MIFSHTGRHIIFSNDNGISWNLDTSTFGAPKNIIFRKNGLFAYFSGGGVIESSDQGRTPLYINDTLPFNAKIVGLVERNGRLILATDVYGIFGEPPPSDVQKNIPTEPEWHVFPNPVSTSILNIESVEIQNTETFEIFNMLGNIISRGKVQEKSNANFSIDIGNLPPGAYFCHLINSGKSLRFIVQ